MTEVMSANEATGFLAEAKGHKHEGMNTVIETMEIGKTYNIGGRELTLKEIESSNFLNFTGKDKKGSTKEIRIGYFSLLHHINGTGSWGDEIVEQTAKDIETATS